MVDNYVRSVLLRLCAVQYACAMYCMSRQVCGIQLNEMYINVLDIDFHCTCNVLYVTYLRCMFVLYCVIENPSTSLTEPYK